MGLGTRMTALGREYALKISSSKRTLGIRCCHQWPQSGATSCSRYRPLADRRGRASMPIFVASTLSFLGISDTPSNSSLFDRYNRCTSGVNLPCFQASNSHAISCPNHFLTSLCMSSRNENFGGTRKCISKRIVAREFVFVSLELRK